MARQVLDRYVCDRCKAPLVSLEGIKIGRVDVWAWAQDGRNPLNARSNTRPSLPNTDAEHTRRWAPDLSVTSPRFPVPKKARRWSVLLHPDCTIGH
jgi:hypothetical protein